MSVTTTISALGHKGEGVAEIEGRKVFVPFTLPGETVTIAVDGERGTLERLVTPSPHRATPPCPHFGICGGCQLQHLDAETYRAFKIGLVERPLRQAGIAAKVEDFIAAGGAGRRRATLHARREGAGYMRARSHQVHDIDRCPILVPALARAPDIARAVLEAVGEADVGFTATETGLDVAVRTQRQQARPEKLTPLVARFGLARLALNGEMILMSRVPLVRMGKAEVELPVGSFLKATETAEAALADYVLRGIGKARHVADLFCGVGPFALRLAEQASVFAVDNDRAGIAALDKARRHAKGLKAVTAKARDLFRDPLTRFELDYDAVVLDPPRAGAEAQVREVAASKVRRVVMVACDASSFARDAASLLKGGFSMAELTAFDQFTWSSHIEIAATFTR